MLLQSVSFPLLDSQFTQSWLCKRLICKITVSDKEYRQRNNTFSTWNDCSIHKIYTDTPTLSVRCLLLFSNSLWTHTTKYHWHSNFFKTDSWLIQSLVMNSVSVSSENKEVEFTCVVPPVWMWRETVYLLIIVALQCMFLTLLLIQNGLWKYVHLHILIFFLLKALCNL